LKDSGIRPSNPAIQRGADEFVFPLGPGLLFSSSARQGAPDTTAERVIATRSRPVPWGDETSEVLDLIGYSQRVGPLTPSGLDPVVLEGGSRV
jgi:hypothetical protein